MSKDERGRAASFVFPAAEEFQRIWRTLLDSQATLGAAMSADTYARLQEPIEYLDRTMSAPYQALEQWQRGNRRIIELASRPLGQLVDSERRFASLFNRLDRSLAAFNRPSQTLIANVKPITDALAHLDAESRSVIASTAFRPQLEFSAACFRLLGEIREDAADPASELRVTQTVQTAGAEATAISEVIVEGIATPLGGSAEVWRPPATMSTFNLHEMILTTVADVVDVGPEQTLITDALRPILQCSLAAREVVHLIYQIIALPFAPDREPVFKASASLFHEATALLGLIAHTEPLFREFVTYMYRLIYDAAGADNNRLNNYLDKAEFQVVQDIKHIRIYQQHHLGDSRDSQRKKQKAREVFTRLIGRPEPNTAEDYRKAQLALLRNTKHILARVVEKLQRS